MTTLTTGKATEFIQFTRASNATVTDSDGKIKWAPHNLLTNSESFDAASWVKTGATVVANAGVAPNGTTTADQLSVNANVAGVYVTTVVTAAVGEKYRFGVWLKGIAGEVVNVGINIASTDATYVQTTLDGTWQYVTGELTATTAAALSFHFRSDFPVTAGQVGAFVTLAWGAHVYRSDLGGMQANTSAYPMYNPTTPKNLLGSTEDFSAAAWVKTRATIVSNLILAPNGLQTADKIVADTASNFHSVYQGINPGSGVFTFSFYAKAAEYSLVYASDGSAGQFAVAFNLATGTVVAGSPAGPRYVSSSIVSAGDGWYRCAVVMSGLTASIAASLIGYPAGATLNAFGASYTGDGTSGVYIWGAQLSDSASLDSYVPVYGAAVTSAAYYGPRRDFDSAGVCKGLLVEEQRTNLALYSSDFSNAAWNSGSLRTLQVTTDQTTAPDGTNTADKVVEAAAGAGSVIHRLIQIEATASAQKVFSVYAKKAERKRIYLFVNGPDDGGWFDLDLGTSGAATDWPGGVTSITPVGNGWYRCSLIPGTASTGQFQIAVISNTATTFDARVGDGTSGVYLWGAQLEPGSFATSYTPTGAATATRNADRATLSLQAFPYSNAEGTWVFNISRNTAGGNNWILGAAGIAGTYDLVAGNTNGNFRYGATGDINGISSNAIGSSGGKIAGAYTLNGTHAISINGTAVVTTSTSTDPGTPTVFRLGVDGAPTPGSELNGHIRQITYLPRRISNTELQTRTS